MLEWIANLGRVALAVGGIGILLVIGQVFSDFLRGDSNQTLPIVDATLSTPERISISIFLLAATALTLLLGLINALNR
jgi:hypothetical protein